MIKRALISGLVLASATAASAADCAAHLAQGLTPARQVLAETGRAYALEHVALPRYGEKTVAHLLDCQWMMRVTFENHNEWSPVDLGKVDKALELVNQPDATKKNVLWGPVDPGGSPIEKGTFGAFSHSGYGRDAVFCACDALFPDLTDGRPKIEELQSSG